MFDRLFGEYLIQEGKISRQDLDRVYERQDEIRERIGDIAVSEGLLTREQSDELNELQAEQNAHFLELAVEKKYISKSIANDLIMRQGGPFDAFSKVVIREFKLVDEESFNESLLSYQDKYNRSDEDMDALKKDDIDRIVLMHLGSDDLRINQMTSICLKNMLRLVDRHLYIGQCVNTGALEGEVMAGQPLSGGMDVYSVLAGDYESMRRIAVGYVGEEYLETVDDVMDALCELINTFDGMFVRQEIGEDEELEPPHYKTEPYLLEGAEIYEIPIHACGVDVIYALARGATMEEDDDIDLDKLFS